MIGMFLYAAQNNTKLIFKIIIPQELQLMAIKVKKKLMEDKLWPNSFSEDIQKISENKLLELIIQLKESCVNLKNKSSDSTWRLFYELVASEEFSSKWTMELGTVNAFLSLICLELCTELFAEGVEVKSLPQHLPGPMHQEEDVVAYIAGYSVRNIMQKLYKVHDYGSIYCLKAMLCDNIPENEEEHYLKMILTTNRGGLSIPTESTFKYFLFLEETFRKEAKNYVAFETASEEMALKLFMKTTEKCDLDHGSKKKLNKDFMKLYYKIRIHAFVKKLQEKCANVKKEQGFAENFEEKCKLVLCFV